MVYLKFIYKSMAKLGLFYSCRDRLQEQGAAVISDQVLPAYRRLKHFINQVNKFPTFYAAKCHQKQKTFRLPFIHSIPFRNIYPTPEET